MENHDVSDTSVQVVILMTCYNGRSYIDDCLRSVFSSQDANIERKVVVVDNASQDGTAAFVQETFPQVDLQRNSTNLGYAGGANAGWEHARRTYPKARFLVLLNQDTVVRDGWLAPLVEFLQQNDHAGIVGPKVLLESEPNKINTLGNRSHFLGFGFVTAYGQLDQGQFDQSRSVDFVSGAALMIRTDLISHGDLFNEAFFMYLEDADLAWRLGQIGYQSYVVPASVVGHCYAPDAPNKYYYYLERNRWILLLVYYKLLTLLLLLPAILLMELGQVAYAFLNGCLFEKLRSYGYFLQPRHLRHISRWRRHAQRRRITSDRQFLNRFTGTIDHMAVNGFLLRYVGNPLLGAYWWIAKQLIVW